jgi:aspartate racemase
MKTIGLIGGTTWHSTTEYYKLLNELVQEKLGGVASAEILIRSVNFAEIKSLTELGRWDLIAAKMSGIAQQLEQAGAECLLLGANTMHKIADEVQSAINIPLIHIAAATAKVIQEQQIHTVALLGTRYVMQMDFYKNMLADQGIQTLIPDAAAIDFINRSIYEEMSCGQFLPATAEKYLQVMEQLKARGAEGMIMGCTEIPILLKNRAVDYPLFDTARIHVEAALDFALN